MLKNVSFFDRKWSKVDFKKWSISRKLRDFWNLLLWKRLVDFCKINFQNWFLTNFGCMNNQISTIIEGSTKWSFPFFWKIKISGYPLFQISFSQNCLAHPHTKFQANPTNSFWEKWHFLSKIGIFKNFIFWPQSQHSVKLAPCGFHQRIQRPLF